MLVEFIWLPDGEIDAMNVAAMHSTTRQRRNFRLSNPQELQAFAETEFSCSAAVAAVGRTIPVSAADELHRALRSAKHPANTEFQDNGLFT